MAFHIRNCVGTRDDRSFAVQWLACALPCRRFAGALAGVCARLGADVDRYSFTVRDLHPLLLAGLPAHSENLHNKRHWTRRLKLKRPPTEAAYFIVNWKTDSPKRILGACQKPPWVIIDPVNAARFMTAASTLQRRARSAALNAPYAVKPSRIGTPLGFLDIVSLPVQLGMPNDRRPQMISLVSSGLTL